MESKRKPSEKKPLDHLCRADGRVGKTSGDDAAVADRAVEI